MFFIKILVGLIKGYLYCIYYLVFWNCVFSFMKNIIYYSRFVYIFDEEICFGGCWFDYVFFIM